MPVLRRGSSLRSRGMGAVAAAAKQQGLPGGRGAAQHGSRAAAAAAPVEQPVAEYTMELQAAVDAVKLASRLCQVRRGVEAGRAGSVPLETHPDPPRPAAPLPPSAQAVQVQLKRGEWSEKEDDSPVTVADYGAQALVAWSLQQSLPGQRLSMVAEEDAVDLRAPEGATTLRRITDLVNEALVEAHPGEPLLTPAQVADLVDQGCSEGGAHGRHWVLDPIDGTRGFVGMRQYAVCLGLLDEGQVRVGRGDGARRWPARGAGCLHRGALHAACACTPPTARRRPPSLAPFHPGGAGRAGLPQPPPVGH